MTDTIEQQIDVKEPRKKRSSDFTLEEKKSLVDRAIKEGYTKVAKELCVHVSMLYNWAFKFKYNKNQRSKKIDTASKIEEANKGFVQTDKTSDTSVTISQEKQQIAPISNEVNFLRKQISVLEIENARLKEKVEYLTGQATKLKTALSTLIH